MTSWWNLPIRFPDTKENTMPIDPQTTTTSPQTPTTTSPTTPQTTTTETRRSPTDPTNSTHGLTPGDADIWEVDIDAVVTAGVNLHSTHEEMTDTTQQINSEMVALVNDDLQGKGADAFTQTWTTWIKEGQEIFDRLEKHSSVLGSSTSAAIAGDYETAHAKIGGQAA